MSSSQVIIDIENLTRVYDVGAEQVTAVKDVTMQIPPGQFIALVGRSGSGKTTLLNLMAGLDKPTSGTILFEGEDLAAMGEKDLTNIRRHKVGFVFQAFGLLPLLSAFENVELALENIGLRCPRTRRTDERSAWDRRAAPALQTTDRTNYRAASSKESPSLERSLRGRRSSSPTSRRGNSTRRTLSRSSDSSARWWRRTASQ